MTARIVRSDEHHHKKQGWLETYWHFSFDDYFDPENVSFGPLRVFNDDTVQPGGGWGTHPHRDMEIVTYVVEGRIAHEDSSGGHGVLEAGDVQAMTAGRGIWHSEYNPSDEEALRLLQIWILPRERGLPASYRSRRVGKDARNRWLRVVSGEEVEGVLPIEADASFDVARLDAGKEVGVAVLEGRRGYLNVVEGAVTIGDEALQRRDVLRVEGPEEVTLEAIEATELMLLELAAA